MEEKLLARAELSGFILERTAKRVKQRFQQTLKSIAPDLTADQWVLLQILAEQGAMNQNKLADACFKDAPTITRMLELLLKRGLVFREADQADRRRSIIDLSVEGRKLYKNLLPRVKSFREQTWSVLDDNEFKLIESILNRLYERLE